MREHDMLEKEEIFSKVLRAGRRFTEEDGSFHFKKHKIYLYKEDFAAFAEILGEMTSYVLNHKGEEVISERHQKDFKKEYASEKSEYEIIPQTSTFTDIEFDDI